MIEFLLEQLLHTDSLSVPRHSMDEFVVLRFCESSSINVCVNGQRDGLVTIEETRRLYACTYVDPMYLVIELVRFHNDHPAILLNPALTHEFNCRCHSPPAAPLDPSIGVARVESPRAITLATSGMFH